MPLDSTGLSHTKHSLFPRTLFFDVKLCSNNMSIFGSSFPFHLAINRQSTCLFILARKESVNKQLPVSFPVFEVPPFIPACPIINHDVLSVCSLIQSNSLPLIVSQSRVGGDIKA